MDEIKAFGLREAASVYRRIEWLKDYGVSLREPFVKHIEGKLWELRVDQFRVLYFTYTGRKFVMLRAFSKKTDKTPTSEIRLARHRLQDYVSRVGSK